LGEKIKYFFKKIQLDDLLMFVNTDFLSRSLKISNGKTLKKQ